ncbi:MAG: hypothetical protein ACJ71I_01080 [Nitrososphaeraceae archaeon]
MMFFTEKDLLCYDYGTQTFRTTEKGLGFLHLYYDMGDMIRKLPLPRKRRQKVGCRVGNKKRGTVLLHPR